MSNIKSIYGLNDFTILNKSVVLYVSLILNARILKEPERRREGALCWSEFVKSLVDD